MEYKILLTIIRIFLFTIIALFFIHTAGCTVNCEEHLDGCVHLLRDMQRQMSMVIHSTQADEPKYTYSFSYDTVDSLDADIYEVDARITAYNNLPEQTDSTPNTMASGRHVYEGAVALSRDLLAQYKIKWGDIVCLEKPGLCYIVEDTMNDRYDNRVTPGSGHRVDIFMFSREMALQTNYKTKIKILKWRKL